MSDFKFHKGDIVKTMGQVGVILDVRHSDDAFLVKILFARNIGGPRPYDILESTDDWIAGAMAEWELATPADLQAAIEARLQYVSDKATELMGVANGL